MGRPKRLRPIGTALDAVIGFLKALIRDPNAPYWMKLACIDRIAVIDKIYDVTLGGVTDRTRSLKKVEDPEPEVVPEKEPDDTEGKKLLKLYQEQFFNNGGKDGNKSNT